MALTTISIIYDVATAEVRRIIVPEDDSELKYHAVNVMPGEALTRMSILGFNSYRSSLERCQAAVYKVTGRMPSEP